MDVETQWQNELSALDKGVQKHSQDLRHAVSTESAVDNIESQWREEISGIENGPSSVKFIDKEKMDKIPVKEQAEGGGNWPPQKPASTVNSMGVQTDPAKVKPITGTAANAGLGIARAGEQMWNFLDSVENFVSEKIGGDGTGYIEPSNYFKRLKGSQDPMDRLSAGIGEYVLPFFLGSGAANVVAKARGATEGAGFMYQMLASGAVNATMFSPQNEQRFVKTLVEVAPALANPLFDYVASTEGDSDAEGRFKNAVDGVIPDALLAGVIKATPKMFKWFRDFTGESKEIVPLDNAEITAQFKKEFGMDPRRAPPDAKAAVSTKPSDATRYDSMAKAAASVQQKIAEGKPDNLNPATFAGVKYRENDAILEIASAEIDKISAGTKIGPQTMEEIDRAALDVIANNSAFAKLVRGYKPGQDVTLAQLRATQIFTNNLFDDLMKANAQADSGILQDISRRDTLLEQFTVSAQALMGMSEMAGKKLAVLGQATKNIPDVQSFKAAMLKIKALGGIQAAQVRSEQLRQIQKTLQASAGPRFFDAVSKTGGDTAEAVAYIGFNGLTSSPSTAAWNFVQGSSLLATKALEDLNKYALGFVGPKGSAVAKAGKMAEAKIAGYYGSLLEGARAATKTLETGQMFTPSLFNFEPPKLLKGVDRQNSLMTGRGALLNIWSTAVNEAQKKFEVLTTRLNKTQDSFTGMVAYRQSVIESTVSEAMDIGLTPEQTKRLIGLRVTAPSEAQHWTAKKAAAEPTAALGYQDIAPGFLGETAQKFDEGLKATKIGQLLVPFLQAGVNTSMQIMERTPILGLVAPRSFQAYKQGGVARIDVLSKQLAGLEILGMGYFAASSLGLEFTGDGPTDKGTMRALKHVDPGYMPNAIKTADGKYVSLKNSGVVGEVLMMMGQYQELSGLLSEDDRMAMVTGMSLHMMENLTPRQMTENLPKVFGAIQSMSKGDSEEVTRLLQDSATMFVPASGLLRFGRNLMDENQRDTYDKSSAWQTFKNQFVNLAPGFSRSLPPSRNKFGEVVYFPTSFGPDVVSKFYSSTGNDALADELIRLGIYNTGIVPMPDGATKLEINDVPSSISYGAAGMSATVQLDNFQRDRFRIYAAGLSLPDGLMADSEALHEGGFTEEYRSLVDMAGATQNSVPTLKEALRTVLKSMDTYEFTDELQRDELKRSAVKATISAYESIGKAAMFMEQRNQVDIQKQLMNRAKVLGGSR